MLLHRSSNLDSLITDKTQNIKFKSFNEKQIKYENESLNSDSSSSSVNHKSVLHNSQNVNSKSTLSNSIYVFRQNMLRHLDTYLQSNLDELIDSANLNNNYSQITELNNKLMTDKYVFECIKYYFVLLI